MKKTRYTARIVVWALERLWSPEKLKKLRGFNEMPNCIKVIKVDAFPGWENLV